MGSRTNRQAIKVFIIASALAYPVLTFRTWGMSSLPSQFGIISAYGRQQIFETGTLPDHVRGPTWVGSLRDNALHDPLNIIFSAQINIITGTTGIEESLWINELFPWQYFVLIPLFVFAFTRVVGDWDVFRTVDAAILAGFVLFPMASRPLTAFRGFNARSALALALFHVVLTLVLLDATADRGPHKRRILVYGILLAGLFPSHHTWAYYLVAIIGSVGVVGILRGNQSMQRYSLYGIFIWACAAAYIATNQILETSRLLAAFAVQLETLKALLRPTPTTDVAPEYLASLPAVWTPLQIANALAIVSIFVIFGILLVRRYIDRALGPIDTGFGAIYLAQSVIAGGLFVWSGLGGLRARLFEVSIPIGRLLVGYLLVTLGQSHLKNGIRALAVVAVAICLMSVAIYPVSHSNQISQGEAEGIETVGSHMPADQAVFSDFRLGPAFMLYGPAEVYTVDSRQMPANETEDFLDDVYYQDTNPAPALDERVENSDYVVYISARQATVGILDVSLTQFRPTDRRSGSHWSQSQEFNKIYTNGEGVAYHRQKNEQ